jgi:hypothetical protein
VSGASSSIEDFKVYTFQCQKGKHYDCNRKSSLCHYCHFQRLETGSAVEYACVLCIKWQVGRMTRWPNVLAPKLNKTLFHFSKPNSSVGSCDKTVCFCNLQSAPSFDTGKHFYPSLIFACKAGTDSLQRSSTQKCTFTALPLNIKLGWKCLPSSRIQAESKL